jgi:ubiquinone/menaquinone biosynthesis C-methylase UbiE
MEKEFERQVDTSHYNPSQYDHQHRWLSYFYQIALVRSTKARRVLEIGPGNGTVSEALRKMGIQVTTVDIDPGLHPDIVASVTELPVENGAFDLVSACEVLEHIPFKEFKKSLAELARVSSSYVLISLPDARRTLLHLVFKIPLFNEIALRLRVMKGESHIFDGQHYWEIGKRGFPPSYIRAVIKDCGLDIIEDHAYHDAPFYHFFLLKKRL